MDSPHSRIVMYHDDSDGKGDADRESDVEDEERDRERDDDRKDSQERESDFEYEDDGEKKDGFQEFLSKIRLYNRQGPHYIYQRHEEKKIKEPRRLIRKSGKYNVSRHEESQIWDKYLRDFCNTLVHSRWRWTVLAASSSFILTWLMFGVIWMLIANANGDLELQNDRLKCFLGVQGFAGYFMLSLETQTSIGYGGRSLNDHCPEVVFLVCLQIILGVGICGMTINIVYIKMTKSQSVYSKLFSKHAVICRRDGDLSLIFRVRDEDSRHAIGTIVTAYILRKDKESGEPYLETIPLEPHGFLIWPLEIVHKITPTSPLWDVSSYNLLSDKFEVIVTLQGTSPTTAQCSRTRTSYISSEILWGHKFKNCLKFLKKENAYVVNQKNFNLTEEHSTHLCSAKRFVEVCSSLSPTPTPRNYQFKVNILYSAGHRRGTVVSVETADGSSRSEEKSIKSVVKDEKKLEENKPNQILERPSTLSLPSSYNQPKTFSSRNEVSVAKPEITTEMYSNSQENQWEYQNYSGTHLPDFWLKETASLPLINDYNQEQGLKTRKFGSDLQNRRMKSFHAHLGNSNGSKGLLSPHRIFEGEEFVFDHSASAGESNASLISNYQRSQEIEYETDLNTMLRSMESYLEQNSTDGLSRASSPFPKS